ncbi:MAG: DNA topoisomerase IV subunit A [Verrucomicrobia bacterium]|nr:DNA topoisomerase IV subunit A [Kiritimatiellia bacterium]MCP5487028.1 DNA topoisomerase IV subunit A [Verrucomicrobiota bacterium]
MSHDPEQPDLFAEKPRTPKKRSKKAAARPASPEPALEAPTVEDTDGVESGLPAHQIRGPFRDLVDTNFLDYAAYVIKDRAIPDIDDGLKPVQRRILHSLHEKDDGKFIKVANIVGYTMQYHPHGDASIADALIALVNKRYLIEGQGNFGNIFTGDAAAAPRYIECRLTELARKEMFNDALTECIPSYDGRNKEPVTLPCKLPLLLMLGAEGIAVGLSTRILPHNFIELLEAQIAVLRKKPFTLYPDFQQGGMMDVSEYDRGNGRVKVRAVIEVKDKDTLVIKEIPFGTTTDSLISSIEDAARKKKIKIRSISDFTAESIEIEVNLMQGQSAEKTIQSLYAFTACEIPLSSNLIVIQDRRPVAMTVDEVVRYSTKRLVILLEQELAYEKQKLLDELHRKTLVQIFIENRIYKDIEQCKTYEAVTQAVLDGVNKFRKKLRRDVTMEDVEMLLGVRIKRISLFDINKNRQELDDIVKALDEVNKNLGRLTQYAIAYLKGLIKTYKDAYPRRTQIEQFEAVELRALTANELSMRWDRENGYFGSQVDGEVVFKCSSLDKLIFVWDDGRYKLTTPQDKVFVDHNLLYAAIFDRDRVMTAVYVHQGVTYFKKFAFGGTIMNRDYSCTQDDSKIILFSDAPVEQVYVKYAPVKNLRIKQQVFDVKEHLVKGAKARGNQMTVKKIRAIATEQPRGWDTSDGSPKGAMLRD